MKMIKENRLNQDGQDKRMKKILIFKTNLVDFYKAIKYNIYY